MDQSSGKPVARLSNLARCALLLVRTRKGTGLHGSAHCSPDTLRVVSSLFDADCLDLLIRVGLGLE